MKKNSKGFFGGLLLGSMMGVVSALVMAPKSGKKTRDAIKKKGKDLRDTVSNVASSVDLKVREFGENHKEDIAKIKEKVREVSQKVSDSLSSVTQSVKEKAENVADVAKEEIYGSENDEKPLKSEVKNIAKDLEDLTDTDTKK